MRIGIGYDVHALVPGRRLILGGVEIPFHLGLQGHSDADVLCHAVADAVLGAAALGDIGQHFPDTDPQFAGASSIELLRRVRDLIAANGLRVGNVDTVVVAQAPKLASCIPAMRQNLAEALGSKPECIGVKATTTEGLGFEGEGRGIAAHAVALVVSLSPDGAGGYERQRGQMTEP